MDISNDLKVLSAGYSIHQQPFHIQHTRFKNLYLFRYQSKGTSQVFVQGQMAQIHAGDLQLFGPGDEYELLIQPSNEQPDVFSEDYYLFLRGTWMDQWWKQNERSPLLSSPANENLLTLFRQITAEKRKASALTDEITTHFAKILCLSIDRALFDQPIQGKAYVAKQMKHYIEEHADQPFTLANVAHAVDLSISRAVHLFKETYQQTIMNYALEVRLQMAREQIIYTPVSLTDIAERTGFSSYTYFFRVFKKQFGLSPSEFRAHYSAFNSL